MLIPGYGQAYFNSKAINKNGENGLVGKGIYFSPHFVTCFGYTRLA